MKTVSVGRAPENDWVVQDTLVSSKHLLFLQDEAGNFFIEDLQSTNGTWVDGELLRGGTRAITPQSVVKLGETVLDWQARCLPLPTKSPPMPEPTQTPIPNVEAQPMPTGESALPAQNTWQWILWGLIGLGGLLLFLLMVWYFTYVCKP